MTRPTLFFLALGGAIVLSGSLFADKPGDGVERGDDPLSPAEALETFVLSPELDLRIDMVACEPDVIDPVAIAFDEKGRMFVVEMRDYPTGPVEGKAPRSRVRLLEDTDGDGRYETGHLFAGGLEFPTGLLPWKGGVIVTLAGEVRYLKDTNGDHKADVNEVWFEGFAERNTQLRANHPTLGPDGWVYIANGLRGGTVTTVREGWPEQSLKLRQGDFRFNPRTGEAEVVAGGSQFGLAFDAWGHRFICSNRNPCDQIVLEREDLERNPALAVGEPIEVVAAAGNDSRVYPLTNAWTTSTLHAGQFTAACGVMIYDGDALPGACLGNVFTCEPTGSLVHREILTPRGGTFDATPAEEKASFLASTDSWFRPVNLTVGPDGALYVVDMYRAVIEHPRWMPQELKNRRDMRWGDECGRIYRIAAKDNPPGKIPTIDAQNVDELYEALASSNGWMRETASRLLWEDPERLQLAELKKLAESAGLPQSRVRAVQLAAGVPKGEASEIVQVGVNDADPRVVAGSVVVAGRLLDRQQGVSGELRDRLLELAGSDDATVRFEVARVLGKLKPSAAVTEALARIAARDAGLHWSRAAVLSSTGDPLALYDAVISVSTGGTPVAPDEASKARDGVVPFLAELAEFIGRRGKLPETTGLLERLAKTGPESGWATPILLGLGRGMGGSLEPALEKVSPRTRGRFEALFAWAASIAGDLDAAVSQRKTLVSLIALAERSFALPVLLDLMDTENTAVRVSVARALGRFRNDERIAPALLEDFGRAPPTVRSAALTAILADPGRVPALLDAVEEEVVSVAELGPTRIAALRRHPNEKVQARAKKLFAPPADRQEVLKKYQGAATMNGDSRAGRILFQKNCATCHRIGNLGTQVGPDIADSRTRTPKSLLSDILNPNRAIDGKYLAYTVLTNDGVVQTGIILSETSASVTLAQPEGKTLTIPRDEIAAIHSDGLSLMPVGIERTVSPEEMADLISFIKNWRYLGGAVPLRGASP